MTLWGWGGGGAGWCRPGLTFISEVTRQRLEGRGLMVATFMSGFLGAGWASSTLSETRGDVKGGEAAAVSGDHGQTSHSSSASRGLERCERRSA